MDNLFMVNTVLALVLIVYAAAHGAYANPLWKLYSGAEFYAGGFWRALIGLPAWVAAIMLLMFNHKGFLIALLITAGCMAIPVMRMNKDKVAKPRNVMLLLWASMGAYARVLLNLTILGIPVCIWTKRAAEVGWEQAAYEFGSCKRDTSSSSSFSDIFSSGSKTQEESSYSEPEVEVWKEQDDGSKKKMRTNSDNSMYWDPDEQEWKKINK